MPLATPLPTRFLRKPTVVERVGLSGTTIWRMVRAGQFPAPLRLSRNSVGWREAEVEAWMASRAVEPCSAPKRLKSATGCDRPVALAEGMAVRQQDIEIGD